MIINTKEKTMQAAINNWLISNTQQGNNLCFIPDITWHSYYLQGKETLPQDVKICLTLGHQLEIQLKS